jgi:DNA-binding IclR family transcriptional regulator
MPAPDYLVQSLVRGVSILTAFSLERPDLTIGEIAQQVELPRSTVHRIVVNLVRLGLLTRDPRTDRYHLGLLLVELGAIAVGSVSLREKALPTMEQLAAQTSEAVFLAVLDLDWAVYVEKVEGRHNLRMTATIGRRAPLHCTATGKTLLAYLSETEIRRIAVATGLPRRTARTIIDVACLVGELELIRQRGYTIDDGESEDGLVGVAAPVRDVRGDVIAALAVAGPGPRLTAERQPELATIVRAAADQISWALGYQALPRSDHALGRTR